jgi:hypothetical protein
VVWSCGLAFDFFFPFVWFGFLLLAVGGVVCVVWLLVFRVLVLAGFSFGFPSFCLFCSVSFSRGWLCSFSCPVEPSLLSSLSFLKFFLSPFLSACRSYLRSDGVTIARLGQPGRVFTRLTRVWCKKKKEVPAALDRSQSF